MAQQQPIQNKQRDKLDRELREIQMKCLGYHNTYFEPTEKTRLKYDAIVYKLGGMDVKNADNRSYFIRNGWDVTCISQDPETIVPRMIQEHFERCSPGKPFVSDNLYHFPFTIYY